MVMAMAKNQKGTKVTFALSAPDAKEVMLAGSFNNWNYKSTPLQKSKNNVWTKDLTLKPGKYEYKFVVDKKNWINDPKNINRIRNSFGTENSIIEI